MRFCTSKLKKGKIDKDECHRYEDEAAKLLYDKLACTMKDRSLYVLLIPSDVDQKN